MIRINLTAVLICTAVLTASCASGNAGGGSGTYKVRIGETRQIRTASVIPADLKIIVRLNTGVYQFCRGEWKEMTKLFGNDNSSADITRLGPWHFSIGDSIKPEYHLVDLYKNKVTPLTVVQRERFTGILKRTSDGTVWWMGASRTGCFLWKNENGKNTPVYSRPGTSRFEISQSGACCWTVNPGIGKKESSEFADMVPGFSAVLYWASYPGGEEKVLAKSGTILDMRFIDEGHIAYWSDGSVSRGTKTKQWILNSVDISTAKVTEVCRHTVGTWETSGIGAPPIITGQGVLAWSNDWDGGIEPVMRSWSILREGGKSVLSFTGGNAILKHDTVNRSGYLAIYDEGQMSIVIVNLATGSRSTIPCEWKSFRFKWVEVIAPDAQSL